MIENSDGAENVFCPLRELQSKKFITKTFAQKTSTGETTTVHIKAEGPVSGQDVLHRNRCMRIMPIEVF